jgi:hypothetical protein
MKTCPECGIALQDEYQFCPEDGASLDQSNQIAEQDVTAAAQRDAAPVVVLYCPACAAEYPLTFSECPVHHTALTRHNVPARVTHQPRARRLHLVSPAALMDEQPNGEASESQTRQSGIEAYEAALENLVEHKAGDEAVEDRAVWPDDNAKPDEASKYRKTAMAVAVALALLALVGIYALVSNASRKPVTPSKGAVATKASAQQTITVETPQAALDYPDEGFANARVTDVPAASKPTTHEATADARVRPQRGVTDAASTAPKMAERQAADSRRAQMVAPTPRPAPIPAQTAPVQSAPVQSAMMRQPAATELVLPRGTFGQVAARLTGVRAARTMGGYRYELTFHLADQVGQATQWERLAIVTRTASGATRQQQIPFYHRLGADGTMSFTVRVEMPGRAPADWQGRIICTSIGSDSNGRVHRASFGANVSPN